MRGICPECKVVHPVDENDRMADHLDRFGSFSCEGVGQDCGTILPEKKIRNSKIHHSKFDHEMGDEDEHAPDSSCGVVGLPTDKEYIPLEVKPLLPPKPGLFGTVGMKIVNHPVFGGNAKKLSQKERKAQK